MKILLAVVGGLLLLIFPFIQEISAARQHPAATHSP